MLFSFLQYVSPSWYYNLKPDGGIPYFLDYEKLPEKHKSIVNIDLDYSSWEVTKLDAAYQGFHKGIISSKQDDKLDILRITPTVNDNYRFIKRYFNPIWVYYVFVIRIFTLHNPIKEIRGLLKSLKVKKLNLYQSVADHTLFDSFASSLLASNPLVSVVIPTLNRYNYLRDVLIDLESQIYNNFEVIVIDQSHPYDAVFYNGWNLDLKVVHQEERALWLARNSAIKMAKGNYILLYDDDSRVEHEWIKNHLKCIDYYNAEISSGVSLSTIGAKIPTHYSFFRWSDQIDTGNVLIKREVFESIGLFDRQFEKQRQGDGEFGLRAYLKGFKNISNPRSHRIHLKVSEGGLREMGSWDGFRPKNWFAPRPIPSIIYLIRKYFGIKAAISTLFINVPPSLLPYKFKRNKYIFVLGYISCFLLLPIILLSVFKSWRRADKMLNEGPKIDKLEKHKVA